MESPALRRAFSFLAGLRSRNERGDSIS